MTNKIKARGKKRRDKKNHTSNGTVPTSFQIVCGIYGTVRRYSNEDQRIEIGEIWIEEKWRDRGGGGVPLGILVVLVGARREDHAS